MPRVKYTKNGYPYWTYPLEAAKNKEGEIVPNVFQAKVSINKRRYIVTITDSKKDGVSYWLTFQSAFKAFRGGSGYSSGYSRGYGRRSYGSGGYSRGYSRRYSGYSRFY